MLPRRSGKKFTSDYASPTSDSLRGNPPPNIVTDQQTLRPSITGIPETESPASSPRSQTASPAPPFPQPQITPLVPNRPPPQLPNRSPPPISGRSQPLVSGRSPPPLPERSPPPVSDRSRQLVFPDFLPGIGGFRRSSTRRDTLETFISAPEEHRDAPTSPQSPSIPLPQVLEHPPTQIQQQQPGQGGGAGKPAAATPFHNKTAKYAYRLDTMSSAGSNPDSPQHKPAALTGDIHEKIWPTYNKISKEFDGKILEKSDSDLDVLLIFVSGSSLRVIADSDRTDTICRLLCSLPSSQLFSSRPSTIYHRIINNSRPCSFTSF